MQFDARVDAFVPRIESIPDFFWGGGGRWRERERKKKRRGREKRRKKQTIPGINRIAFQWPTVVDDEYKGLNGVQRVLDSETITRNAF